MLPAWNLSPSDFPDDAAGRRAQLRACLRWAVLAPSSHNSQPWFFRTDDEQVLIFADRARALPVVDPDDRELTISCGAVAGHLEVALARFGFVHATTWMPDRSRPDLVARVRLEGGARRAAFDDGLFDAITTRHTTRSAFEPRPVARDAILALEAEGKHGVEVRNVEGHEDRARVCSLVAEGDTIQLEDRRFRRELAAWMHDNRDRSRDGIPGYALGLSDTAAQLAPFIVRTFDTGEGQAAQDKELAEGSPLLTALLTEEDNPRAWLETGRVLSRLLLRATTLGLRTAFLNQPVEVPELRPRLAEALETNRLPQLLLRIGHGPVARATPRRTIEDVLLD